MKITKYTVTNGAFIPFKPTLPVTLLTPVYM